MCKNIIRLRVHEISSEEKKDSDGNIQYEERPTDRILNLDRVAFEGSCMYGTALAGNYFFVAKQVLNMYGFTNHQYISYFREQFITDGNDEKVGMRIRYIDGHGDKLWWILREI